MNHSRLLFAVMIGLGIARNAHGESLPLHVKLELNDGREVEARCLTPTFRLKTDYGTLDLDLNRVRDTDFQASGDRIRVVAVLSDKSRIVGTALTSEIVVEGANEPLKVADLRKIKVIRETDSSLFAIIFGLVTLTVMEIVLGIDNIIFLAIVAGRLPPAQQPKARRIGLVAALGTRLGLLFTLTFVLGLTKPILTLPLPWPWLSREAAELSWRDIILLIGGGFLIVKSVRELHQKVEETRGDHSKKIRKPAGFVKTILLIAVIDIVFSLDSVITAVGMVETLWVMVAAMVLAMGVMLLFAEPVSRFVERYPTVKVLALSFLILIGVLLVAEGLGQHIDKGYVYFAMAFAVGIEFINMSLRPKPLAEAVADG
jgi:predicted tellurium resistance membrane protein TerC